MERYALIDNGIVQNVILWDGDTEAYTPPFDAVLDDGTAQVGSTYANGVFTAPDIIIPVPESVTPAQGRIALLRGGLLDQVKALVASVGADTELGIWWDYATVWERHNTNVLAFAAQLGLSDDQVDDLFRLAGSL